MPLARDEKGGGTNADGSKSNVYCSHCFEGGRFTLPDLTVEQMQARVRTRLTSIGMPEPAAAGLAAKIPELSRWATRT
jgi:hypothetical protein